MMDLRMLVLELYMMFQSNFGFDEIGEDDV